MRFRTAPFFLLLLGWTWAFHIPLAAMQRPASQFPYSLLFLLGGLGPPAAASIFVLLTRDVRYVRQYVSRIVSLRRAPLRLWPAVVGLPFLVVTAGTLLGNAVSGAGAGTPPRLDPAFAAGITPFYLLLMLLAPLLEEVAWRGYGQDALQSRFGPVRTSLVLGLVWWLWHLPLFLMTGTYQSSLSVGTAAFWDFAVFTVASTFVMTWLFNVTRGSILAAIVYHLMLNLANEVLLTGAAGDFGRSAVQVALALFLLVLLPRLHRGGAVTRSSLWRPAGGG
jgi:membrane protease YdiL (CAAX protease family)